MSKCNQCEKHCNKHTTTFAQCATRIRNNYERFCNEYLRLFCLKHDFDYEESRSSWVANDIGETVSVGDLFFDMRTIRVDIDRNVPEEELLKWYDYSMELAFLDIPSCNYNSWVSGCPRMSEADMQQLKELKANVRRAEEIFTNSIEEYKEKYLKK